MKNYTIRMDSTSFIPAILMMGFSKAQHLDMRNVYRMDTMSVHIYSTKNHRFSIILFDAGTKIGEYYSYEDAYKKLSEVLINREYLENIQGSA